MMTKIKTFSELTKLDLFYDRYEYLRMGNVVGQSTFGFDRWVNQLLYKSKRWRRTRDEVIMRDNGCDLGVEGYEIKGRLLVHHMNPITMDDIENDRYEIYCPEFLVCTSHLTHQAIHFSDETLLPKTPVPRTKNDTIPWK